MSLTGAESRDIQFGEEKVYEKTPKKKKMFYIYVLTAKIDEK